MRALFSAIARAHAGRYRAVNTNYFLLYRSFFYKAKNSCAFAADVVLNSSKKQVAEVTTWNFSKGSGQSLK